MIQLDLENCWDTINHKKINLGQCVGGEANGFCRKTEALCRSAVPGCPVVPYFLPATPPLSPVPPPHFLSDWGLSGPNPAPTTWHGGWDPMQP